VNGLGNLDNLSKKRDIRVIPDYPLKMGRKNGKGTPTASLVPLPFVFSPLSCGITSGVNVTLFKPSNYTLFLLPTRQAFYR
jgi:hypothetical protein